jgi:hypothetical protein
MKVTRLLPIICTLALAACGYESSLPDLGAAPLEKPQFKVVTSTFCRQTTVWVEGEPRFTLSYDLPDTERTVEDIKRLEAKWVDAKCADKALAERGGKKVASAVTPIK